MYDRSLRQIGNIAFVLIFPCLILALAALPTSALKADEPLSVVGPPAPCLEGTTYLPMEDGGEYVCCASSDVVDNDGILILQRPGYWSSTVIRFLVLEDFG